MRCPLTFTGSCVVLVRSLEHSPMSSNPGDGTHLQDQPLLVVVLSLENNHEQRLIMAIGA